MDVVEVSRKINFYVLLGDRNETVCSRLYRNKDTYPILIVPIVILDITFYRIRGEIDHCMKCYNDHVGEDDCSITKKLSVQ